jgi:uncharacterized membrane protein YebE (DUF533 family)
MGKNKKIAIIIASIVGVIGLGYLGYWLYNRSQLKSGDPQKDNRVFTFNK